MLYDPGLLHPEPLLLQQATADLHLRRRHSNTQRQVWLRLCGISGSWCTQGFVWALWASLAGMGCDSKHDFTPPNILLELLLLGHGVYFFWWDPTFSCQWLFRSKLYFESFPRRGWAHILLLCHLDCWPSKLSWTNNQKRCAFHHRRLEHKSRKSRDTYSNRQIWPWSTKWSRARANRVLSREHTGHSKHLLPTTQEKTLHMDITRWSIPKSDWLYSLESKMEKLYTVSKNKSRRWLWLRSWTPYCQIQT